MDLEFSLNNMDEVIEKVTDQVQKYVEALDIIDKNIANLELKMQTDESKIYETLINKYKTNKKNFEIIKEDMYIFRDKLNSKRDELEQKTNNIKKDFE